MATVIRPKISEKNRYWIPKHRHYELKHFCLQYSYWKRIHASNIAKGVQATSYDRIPSGGGFSDLTAKDAMLQASYSERIKLIEQSAINSDPDLAIYILRGVTEGLSYEQLKTKFAIPCSRGTYYDRYRRFFWILDKERD